MDKSNIYETILNKARAMYQRLLHEEKLGKIVTGEAKREAKEDILAAEAVAETMAMSSEQLDEAIQKRGPDAIQAVVRLLSPGSSKKTLQ